MCMVRATRAEHLCLYISLTLQPRPPPPTLSFTFRKVSHFYVPVMKPCKSFLTRRKVYLGSLQANLCNPKAISRSASPYKDLQRVSRARRCPQRVSERDAFKEVGKRGTIDELYCVARCSGPSDNPHWLPKDIVKSNLHLWSMA